MNTTIAEEDRLPELPTTRHRDYILTAYEPGCAPSGRLHSASLLKHVLREERLAAWPLISALEDELGSDEIVWAAKWGPQGFSVELYFYNFVENSAANSAKASRLAEVARPFVAIAGEVDEALPYFMCSFELSARALKSGRAEPFRLYLRSGDRHRRECGFSYRAEAKDRYVLENHYWFYRAAESNELEDAVLRLCASPRSGGRPYVSRLMPKVLRDCFTICYAVKPNCDGLYYSRISSQQLSAFLERLGKAELVELFRAHENDFAHLRWDLGFDFALPPGAETLAIPKFAIHGVV